MFLTYLFVFTTGLIIGSFITAFSERWPKGESIISGRSRCDNCGQTIFWYDNIPLLSYIFLHGRCRNCAKKISPRYPVIELITGIAFLVIFVNFMGGGSQLGSVALITYRKFYGWAFLLFELLTVFLYISIFIIDFETLYIPDELIYAGIFIYFFLALLTDGKVDFYGHFSAGFMLSFFLLFLFFITKGRGMGLGDVKLAFLTGIILGPYEGVTWLGLSFIIGAAAGLLLILLKKAKFGRHIAFGPYLVISFFIMIFFGNYLTRYFLPVF